MANGTIGSAWSGRGRDGRRAKGTASLLPPAGLAQAHNHMRVVFRSHPRHAPADIHVEGARHNRDGLLQRFLRFLDPADLAERRGEPPIN